MLFGGIKISDPSSDLAIAASIYSSFKNVIITNDILFIGEIGLTGEIRNSVNIEKKVKEALRMNYAKIFCSKYDYIKISKEIKSEKIIGISNICELINKL